MDSEYNLKEFVTVQGKEVVAYQPSGCDPFRHLLLDGERDSTIGHHHYLQPLWIHSVCAEWHNHCEGSVTPLPADFRV